MAASDHTEVPQTLEGYYVLHDVYSLDWSAWWGLEDEEREAVCEEACAWLDGLAPEGGGDSAVYSVVGQKGDLMFVHYRNSPEELNRVEVEMKCLSLADLLLPAYSYLSVIEVSLYEAMAMAKLKLTGAGIEEGADGYAEALEKELEVQKEHLSGRLFRDIPDHKYICFYPMNKRRGESDNWYMLGLDERRAMMRSHGRIGHKYHEQVTQVISGSVGLDDWEWGVSLHSEDALVFKKLIYEMRFDPVSARFAEFGPFYVGVRKDAAGLASLLAGEPR